MKKIVLALDYCLAIAVGMVIGLPGGLVAQDAELTDLYEQFQADIRPILSDYCESCHSGESPEAKFDTTQFNDPQAIAAAWGLWQTVLERIAASEMPPPDESPQPSDDEREKIATWTKLFRMSEAERLRDDPGPISTRRLNNAEFDYSIRDLTGVDIRPAQSFPIDPANEAGFDNSAESLTISPALVAKYLDAARLVADHMLLTPEGIRFAPFPVVTDTDRDKYCVQRIVDFYERQPTQIEDYLWACWLVNSCRDGDSIEQTQARVADELKLSLRYLRLVYETLYSSEPTYGPIGRVRELLDKLPQTSNGSNAQVLAVRTECGVIADFIREARQKLQPEFPILSGPAGMNGGSQSLVLWRNRQMATHRRSCRTEGLNGDSKESLLDAHDIEAFRKVDDVERKKIIQAYEQFCSVFPDAFYIKERGRGHIDARDAVREGKGRLLSAGFHSMMGYFRDDQPLYELVLSQSQQAELDQLWNELDFIAQVPLRQYSGYIWFERAESSFINEEAFHFVRAEDRAAASEAMINRFAVVYLEKVRKHTESPIIIEAVESYFHDMNVKIRRLESQLIDAQPKQLESLLKFAERAYRRPLTGEDRNELLEFYNEVRALPTADHRSAMEDTLISIIVSPSQLYRWDLQCREQQVHPLEPYELASRLSYFLWASLPDELLLEEAAKEMLSNEQSVSQQVSRMIKDERIRGMAREFLGNWLDFRRFETHNGVDRTEFPDFDDELRQAMADEPVEYFLELLRRNGRLTELLESDHMTINLALAHHYGVTNVEFDSETQWQRVDGAGAFERGGLVSMGVFLTQNSPGLRTSPVKRGYWVVRKLLGEKIPPPPPNVPELPSSEHQLGDLTLRELLAQHREHPSCAACHDRFDAAGLLLEGFDPIGRPRITDLGGRTVATDAILPNGSEAEGLVGLRNYILTQRVDDFRRHFCQSLLSFALGRTLILPDDLLVDEMLLQLKQNDDRIQVAFEVIVQSQQFRNKRGASTPTAEIHHGE